MANELLKIRDNKFFPKTRTDELDRLNVIQKLIQSFNQNSDYHYLLRLKIGVKRAWF